MRPLSSTQKDRLPKRSPDRQRVDFDQQENVPCQSPVKLERNPAVRGDSGYFSGGMPLNVNDLPEDEARDTTASASTSAMHSPWQETFQANNAFSNWDFDSATVNGLHTLETVHNPYATQMSSGITTSEPVDWTGQQWWSERSSSEGHPASHLLSAATLLEAEAYSLRQLASAQDDRAASDGRRQTITLPVSFESNDPLHSLTPRQQSAFHEMTLAQNHDGLPGLTCPSLETGYGPWLDMSSNSPHDLDDIIVSPIGDGPMSHHQAQNPVDLRYWHHAENP